MHSRQSFTDVQTLNDLQFPTIMDSLKSFSVSESAAKRIFQLQPTNRFKQIHFELNQSWERLQIMYKFPSFPALEFEELNREISLLGTDDSVLSIEGFMRIYSASHLINEFLLFFKKNPGYSHLLQVFDTCFITEDLILPVKKIFDVTGTRQIKDDATTELQKIRSEIKALRQRINRNFEREMRKLIKDGFLGETCESFTANRRVLTVQSVYKRRIPGTIHGSSKTGSLTYIEPRVNVALNNELDCLFDDEQKEIYKILKSLTLQFQKHLPLIKAYQKALVDFDFITAKARLAKQMEATLPLIQTTQNMHWKQAFHPILKSTNQQHKKTTLAQDFELSPQKRMLVISGPNAGGKSITLKTFGLLQCMLQSGMLIPVLPESKVCFFRQLYSDIGDNQSIENELSTYSYRLKRMKFFLEKAGPKTALLLDEFGTGSDPELGGALAEVFFEKLYETQCFAMVTTHYSSIKLKASELSAAQNGSMKFDIKTLKPLYQLELGIPGSSFTFEVAKINGIPEEMIISAKKSLSSENQKFDKLLSSLQIEKQFIKKSIKDNKISRAQLDEELHKVQAQAEFYSKKSKQLSRQSDEQAHWILLGQKFEKFLNRYQPGQRKKKENDVLMEEIRAFFIKSKLKSKSNKVKATIKKSDVTLPIHSFNIGEKVRIAGTKQVGIIESIDKQKVGLIVNALKISVSLNKLLPF